MKIHHGGHIAQLLDSIYIMSNHKSLLSGGAQQIPLWLFMASIINP